MVSIFMDLEIIIVFSFCAAQTGQSCKPHNSQHSNKSDNEVTLDLMTNAYNLKHDVYAAYF